MKKAIDLMVRIDRHDGGYLCDGHEGKRKQVCSCARGSAKALMAYALLPELWSTSRCLALVLGRRRELDRAWSVLDEKRDADGRYPLDWTQGRALLRRGQEADSTGEV